MELHHEDQDLDSFLLLSTLLSQRMTGSLVRVSSLRA